MALRLRAVASLCKHKQPVRRVIIMGVKRTRRCFGRLRLLQGRDAIGHFRGWWLGQDGRLLRVGLLLGAGGSSEGGSVEVEGARRRGLAKQGLRAGARCRGEHGPAAAGREAGAQGGLVGGGEAATDVVVVAEIVIGRARQHRRAQRAGAQGAAAPGEGGHAGAGDEGRGRGEGGDRRQLGAAGGLGRGTAAKRLLKGVGLEAQRSGQGAGEVVGAVALGAGTGRGRKRFGGFGIGEVGLQGRRIVFRRVGRDVWRTGSATGLHGGRQRDLAGGRLTRGPGNVPGRGGDVVVGCLGDVDSPRPEAPVDDPMMSIKLLRRRAMVRAAAGASSDVEG